VGWGLRHHLILRRETKKKKGLELLKLLNLFTRERKKGPFWIEKPLDRFREGARNSIPRPKRKEREDTRLVHGPSGGRAQAESPGACQGWMVSFYRRKEKGRGIWAMRAKEDTCPLDFSWVGKKGSVRGPGKGRRWPNPGKGVYQGGERHWPFEARLRCASGEKKKKGAEAHNLEYANRQKVRGRDSLARSISNGLEKKGGGAHRGRKRGGKRPKGVFGGTKSAYPCRP